MLQPNIWCLFQLGQKEELLPFDVNPRTVPVKHAAIVVSMPNFSCVGERTIDVESHDVFSEKLQNRTGRLPKLSYNNPKLT